MGACAEIYRAHYAPCIRPRNILSLVQEDAAQQCIHVNENTGICQCHHQKMKESQALQSKGMLKEYLLPDIFPLCNLLSYVLGCCNSLYKHYKGGSGKTEWQKRNFGERFCICKCWYKREVDKGLQKYSTYHIQTDGFQQVLVGMAHMVQTIPLDRKCRVIIDYDPALPKARIETFTDKSDDEQVQGKFPQ